jgi:hypothetical protein
MNLRRLRRMQPLCLLGVTTCLEAIPEPSECLGPDQVIAGAQCLDCPIKSDNEWRDSCITASFFGQIGTLGQNDEWGRFGCLVGEANATVESCTCASGQTPAAPSCYKKSCPSIVVESVGESAQWVRSGLSVEQFSAPGATCGCADALLECDGRGIAFGGVTNMEDTLTLGILELYLDPVQLPSSGRMGVYIRMRGFAAPVFTVIQRSSGGVVESVEGFAFYTLGEFEESVGFEPKDDGLPVAEESRPFQWSTPQEKPTSILIYPSDLVGGEAFHISEIDCVIPFVVPD